MEPPGLVTREDLIWALEEECSSWDGSVVPKWSHKGDRCPVQCPEEKRETGL